MVKKKQELLIKFIAAALAIALFGVLVFGAKDIDQGTDTSYEVVCLGDSNFDNVRYESAITELLSNKTGKTTFNGGFGGSMMVAPNGRKTQYQSALSMHSLAVSISTRNFGVQKSMIGTINGMSGTQNYEATFNALQNIDFDEVEVLIIEHGVNDYLQGVPIKNGTDPYDTSTFCGTIRSVVTMLREEYPNMRIILVTPAYCAPTAPDGSYRYCDETNYGGGYLEEYVNAELLVAEEMGVEIVDLYHLLDMNKENLETYLFDGLHYNEYAREVVADILAECLLGEAE